MITPQQAAAESAKGAEWQSGERQKTLMDAVGWAFKSMKLAAEQGRYECTLDCEWPLGGSAYTSRWPKEFSLKVLRHIKGAGFNATYKNFLIICPWIKVKWAPGPDLGGE